METRSSSALRDFSLNPKTWFINFKGDFMKMVPRKNSMNNMEIQVGMGFVTDIFPLIKWSSEMEIQHGRFLYIPKFLKLVLDH